MLKPSKTAVAPSDTRDTRARSALQDTHAPVAASTWDCASHATATVTATSATARAVSASTASTTLSAITASNARPVTLATPVAAHPTTARPIVHVNATITHRAVAIRPDDASSARTTLRDSTASRARPDSMVTRRREPTTIVHRARALDRASALLTRPAMSSAKRAHLATRDVCATSQLRRLMILGLLRVF